ncbi:MAG: YeiH family protein [Coriobacteriia bacterium]|nr:YeiH family protein [Coriobacteriia bacterium]
MDNVRKRVPGVALCAVAAIPCWFLGMALPVVGGPVFGILLGMVIALFWRGDRGSLKEGIQFSSKKVLQYAVILLGFGLNLAQVAQVGALSLPIIVSTIATALIVAFVMCKVMKVPGRTATLVGVGSSICGGSAIAATAPVIKADDEEVAQAISVIFLFNVVAALIFPTLGTLLGLSNEGFGIFAGTAVNDTSSVTAAAAAWDGMHPGSNALDQATIVKLTRTLAIIPITLVLALWQVRKAKAEAAAAQAQAEGEGALGNFSLKRAFPLFILWFMVASAVTTVVMACGGSAELFAPLKDLSKFFIIMAMFAIGLNTDLVKLVKTGGKPIALGFVCWVCIAAVSLGAQQLLGIW